MKKLIYVILTLYFVIFLFSGCNGITDQKDSENRSKAIIKCFDNRDTETLKKMFCKKTQSEHDLDKEIKAAFDMYSGKSVSYELIFGGTAGGKDNGKWIDQHIEPTIKKLKTDKDKIYRIERSEYLIYKDNPDMVGIVVICLLDENGELLTTIGGWSETK